MVSPLKMRANSNERRIKMKLDTILIFTPHKGLEELTKNEFIENLTLGFYDGVKVEIIETRLK